MVLVSFWREVQAYRPSGGIHLEMPLPGEKVLLLPGCQDAAADGSKFVPTPRSSGLWAQWL